MQTNAGHCHALAGPGDTVLGARKVLSEESLFREIGVLLTTMRKALSWAGSCAPQIHML